MRKLPAIQKQTNEDKTPSQIFKPFEVSLVSLGSFFKYDGVLYIDQNPTVSKTYPNINTPSQYLHITKTTRQIHLPIVCFDNTVVLLLDNVVDNHKKWLYNNTVVPSIRNQIDTFNAIPVEFYDTQDPDILTELSVDGMKQLMKFFEAAEEYNCAAITRNAIEDDEALELHDHEADESFIEGSAEYLAQKLNIPFITEEESD